MTYGCPNNWHGYRGSCLSFNGGSRTYDDANTQCGFQGSKLASIVDDAENKFIFSLIPKSKNTSIPDSSGLLGQHAMCAWPNVILSSCPT